MRLELASRLGLPKATRSLATASLVGSRLFHMNSPTAAWRRVKLKPPPTSRPKPRCTACAVGFRGMTRGVPRCTFPRDSSGSSSRATGEVCPTAQQDAITRTAIADARHMLRVMALLLKSVAQSNKTGERERARSPADDAREFGRCGTGSALARHPQQPAGSRFIAECHTLCAGCYESRDRPQHEYYWRHCKI